MRIQRPKYRFHLRNDSNDEVESFLSIPFHDFAKAVLNAESVKRPPTVPISAFGNKKNLTNHPIIQSAQLKCSGQSRKALSATNDF